jgi:hypothetical protein
MDQVRLFPSPTVKKTVEVKGTQHVFLQGLPSRGAVTVMLTICGDGTKLRPVIILRSKSAAKWLVVQVYRGFIVMFQRNAYTDNRIMKLYFKHVVEPYLAGRRGLLILDNFSCHKSPSTIAAMNKMNCAFEFIPKTCTPYVQPLDVSINKPFKNHYSSQYTSYVNWRLEENNNVGS